MTIKYIRKEKERQKQTKGDSQGSLGKKKGRNRE